MNWLGMESRNGESRSQFHLFWMALCRWWTRLARRSVGVAVGAWVISLGAGAYGFIYGAVTGPKRLNALEHRQDSAEAAWKRDQRFVTAKITAMSEAVDLVASETCARRPIQQVRYGQLARVCGRLAHETGELFAPADSVAKR